MVTVAITVSLKDAVKAAKLDQIEFHLLFPVQRSRVIIARGDKEAPPPEFTRERRRWRRRRRWREIEGRSLAKLGNYLSESPGTSQPPSSGVSTHPDHSSDPVGEKERNRE